MDKPRRLIDANAFAKYADEPSIYDTTDLKAMIAEQPTIDPTERINPKPLTLDELRQMDGEPVWMARAKKWVFVSTVVTEPYAQVWYFFKGFVYTVLYYHEKFYRNKPERSEG